MFGELIGYGDYGFVFEDETEMNGPEGSVIKIMSMDDEDQGICNIQQYNMFAQLMNHQDQGIRTPGLPFIFKHFRGRMDTNILNILSYMVKNTDPDAVRAIRESMPVGTEYGVIIMEKLPCVATNQFCGRNLKDKGNIVEEQSIYEGMVRYLYESGWWVRDLIDPRNIGYNIHGEPVWFDPMVARRQGFPGYSRDAIEVCHEEVAAYPTSYRKAIQGGKYFTERHGYGLFHSEENTVDITKAKNYNQRPILSSSIKKEFQDGVWVGETTNFIPNRVIVVNSLEELLGALDFDSYNSYNNYVDYYINFDLTVYRGSSVEGRGAHGGPKGNWTWKRWLDKKNMGTVRAMRSTNVQPATLVFQEALTYALSGSSYIRPNNFELYSMDIKDYIVALPRRSQPIIHRNCNPVTVTHPPAAYYGARPTIEVIKCDQSSHMKLINADLKDRHPDESASPVIFIYGGVNYEDMTVLWDESISEIAEDYGAESFVSRDYPQCYLCGLPAKIEVLTAIGMRNFCSNKCRGEYEGIDYGPDDYYISPKLEHQLSIVEYNPGIQLDYERDIPAKIRIKCDNCSLKIKYKFDDSHFSKRGDWHMQKDEDGNQLHKEEIPDCEHDMVVIKYISNDYNRAGLAVIRCRKCQLADDLSADIPEGCRNIGSNKPKWFGSEPDWDDIDWTEPPEKDDDWGDEIEWNAESNPVILLLLRYGREPDAVLNNSYAYSPFSINFNVGNIPSVNQPAGFRQRHQYQ